MPKPSPASDLSPETIDRIARRYRGRFLQGYVRGKLRHDPAFQAAFLALGNSSLPVLDLGCGIGLFECYVRESGGAMPLRGLDFDERKIAQARRGTAEYADLEFHAGEAFCGGHAGHVVLLDVLHYLPRAAQGPLLKSIVGAVAPGGCCFIRTALRAKGWRFRCNRAAEWSLATVGWMKAAPRHYPEPEELAAPFRAAGFLCESDPLRGRTPFNSHAFLFRRPLL